MKTKKINLKKGLVLLSILINFKVSLYGQKTDYTDGLPSVKKITKYIQGTCLKDTYARQVAALSRLSIMIKTRELGGSMSAPLTLRDEALLKSYHDAMTKIYDRYSHFVNPLGIKKKENDQEWTRLWTHYEYDSKLEMEILNLFRSKAREKYLATKGKIDAMEAEKKVGYEAFYERKNSENRKTIWKGVLLALSILFIVSSVLINHSLNRYEFENTTDGGVIEFKNYGSKVKHYAKRDLARLMFYAAIILLAIFSFIVYA